MNYLFPILLFFSLNSFTQWKGIQMEETLYIVEVMPEYPGGEEAMFEFIYDNFVFKPYMLFPSQNRIRLYVSFTIMKSGLIKDIRLRKNDNDKSAYQEIQRIIRMMPKWTPGENKGKVVNVEYTIPFTWVIENPYQQYSGRDKLVLINEKIDSSVIYKAPQISAHENDYLPLYWQLLEQNIALPDSFLNDTISHYYNIRGIVNEKGRFNPLKITSAKFSPLIDSLVMDAATKLPDFFPARIDGQLVKSYYNFSFHIHPTALKPDFSKFERTYQDKYKFGYTLFRRYFESEFNYSVIDKSIIKPFHIYVECNINTEGRLENIKCPTLEDVQVKNEVIRVLRTMSGWKVPKKSENNFQKKLTLHLLIDPTDSIPKFTPTPYDRNQNH